MLSFLSLLAISEIGDNFYHHYNNGTHKLDGWYSVDYIMDYSGNTHTQYSTAHDSRYIIDTYYDNQTACELECNVLDNCLGYVNYRVENDTYNCNLLSNLGTESYTNRDSVSYRKFVYYNSPNSIRYRGVSFTTGGSRNMTVYLDLNHNGVFDEGEPHNYTNDNSYFEINGLDNGMHTLRTETDDEMCVQLYPSILGYSYGFMGNGIADYVKYYHSHNNSLLGGVINRSLPFNQDISFNYILNVENNTYLSFTHGDSIVIGFSNEAVMDHEGAELFFNTYENNDTDIYGVVSVSYNNNNFTEIGYLTSNETTFDLTAINYTQPIKLIKIDFYSYSNSTRDRFNIVNVHAHNDLYYSPSFAYYGTYSDRYFIFITDCSFYYRCYTYCDYHVTGFNYMSACEYGCESFQQQQSCNCSYYNESIFHVDTTLNETECNMGCNYALGSYIFPNYTVVDHAEGIQADVIGNYLNLDDTLGFCNSDTDCHGITFDLLYHLRTQNSFNFVYSNVSRFLVRNELIGDHPIDYMSTSPTSTQTSSPTSSQTSSPTSSQTSSPTSSQTSSPTSSETSSPTSSQTTSPTINIDVNTSANSNTDIIIGMSVLGILMVVIAAGYMYNKRQMKKIEPTRYATTPSFSNPAYEIPDPTETGDYLNIDYQDKPVMETGAYMDVSATAAASDV